MNVTTMRRVDAWLGIPLCLLASSLRAALRIFRPSPEAKEIRSVLVIKLSELGALITLGPAMRSLTEAVGRRNLYFLTFGESRGLLEVMDYVPPENIFTLPTDSLAGMIRQAVGNLLRIRRRRIDCTVDLDFFSRATALIGLLSGCRRRVGCHAYYGEGPYRGDLLTHRVKFNPHIHVSQMFEIMARAAGVPAGPLPCIDLVPAPPEPSRDRFKPTTEELVGVQQILAAVGADPQRTLILLNSNISDRESIPLRKWSDEHYVKLAKLVLAGIPDSFVLLTGTPKEAKTIARLEERIGQPNCRSVAGKTTLRQLLTLYGQSAMMITNDSGPAHFATLTDVEVVVLFGPETPLLWRPLGDRVRVLYRGMACSPCFSVYNGRQSRCRQNLCMDITPEEVYEVVRQRLAARHGGVETL